jgi:ArsR family transcriptional regulator, arsenate/arsenite/antimonite-responsive transcriptional repressor
MNTSRWLYLLFTLSLLMPRAAGALPLNEYHAGLPPSSLTFHVQALQRAGLITQRRVSRQLFYAPDFARMDDVMKYLIKNCCQGSSGCATACAPVAARKVRKKPRRAA